MCANGFLEAARLRSLSAFVFFSLHIFQGACMVTRKTSKVSSQQLPLPIGLWGDLRVGLRVSVSSLCYSSVLVYVHVDSSAWTVRQFRTEREKKNLFTYVSAPCVCVLGGLSVKACSKVTPASICENKVGKTLSH